MAPYALFGAVALGMLSQIPGSPAERARTLLAVLPVGWLLVTLGTLLSVSTAAATAGMFVLGFVVSFVGVGGPRLVGLAAGAQLLYILPVLPAVRPGVAGLAAGRGDAGRAAARGGRAGAVARSDAGAVHREAGQGRRRARRLPDGARGRLDGPGGGGGPAHRPAAGGGRGRRRAAAVAVAADGAARVGGASRPGADDRGGDGPAPAGPRRRPARRRRPPRDRPARRGRPPAPGGVVRGGGGGVAAGRGPRRRRGARHGPRRRRARRVPRRPGRHAAGRRAAGAAAAELARAEPRGVDEVPRRRGAGGRGRTGGVGRARAAGRCGSPTCPPRGCGGSACASTSRRGRCTSRARCGWLRRSRWPGCSRACSTCRTGSGCC